MSREALITEMVADALAEDTREGGSFDVEGFGNFFPEYRLHAENHGIEWDDEIWGEAYSEYHSARRARCARYYITHTDSNGEKHQLTGAYEAATPEEAIAVMLNLAQEDDDGAWQAHVVTSDNDLTEHW